MNKKGQENDINYYEAEITCITCSNIFTVGSTKGKEIRVDACSKCHPFYTGQQQSMRADGQVEKFAKQQAKQQEILKQQIADAKNQKPIVKNASKKSDKLKEVSLEDLKNSLNK